MYITYPTSSFSDTTQYRLIIYHDDDTFGQNVSFELLDSLRDSNGLIGDNLSFPLFKERQVPRNLVRKPDTLSLGQSNTTCFACSFRVNIYDNRWTPVWSNMKDYRFVCRQICAPPRQFRPQVLVHAHDMRRRHCSII